MTKQVGACPECNSTRIERQSSPRRYDDAPNYGCKVCKETFDELVFREPKVESNHLADSLAAKLDAMDPEELSP